jgi:Ser/Thr protein kinase RdoA (MazF antagonist)
VITFAQFAALDDDAQMQRLAELGLAALADWDLPDPALTPIKYRENAVFRVEATDGRRFVLRIHRPGYRSDDHIRSEFAWTRALDRDGIAVPQPMATRKGDLLTLAGAEGVPEARQCDLITWVDGVPAGTAEAGVDQGEEGLRDTYRQIGEFAARVEQHAAAWDKPDGFVRPSWDIDALVGDRPVFGRFEKLADLEPEQLTLCSQARDLVRRRLEGLGPAATFIHGDFLPDNVLVDGAAVRIIDFDDCGWSWAGMEMVTSLYPLKLSGGFEVGMAAYLEGYRSVRAFPEADLEMLDDLMMARGLSYLGWPAGRPEIHSMQPMVALLAWATTDAARDYLAARG